jgi:hypothetical protein
MRILWVVPVDREVGDHALRDERAAHEITHQLDLLILRELHRQGDL